MAVPDSSVGRGNTDGAVDGGEPRERAGDVGDAEHAAGGADVGAAAGVVGIPGQFQTSLGEEAVEHRPAR
jgi:hypothetical protein